MVTERDFELLDDYLGNRMDAAERTSFEQKLQADPDLQTEYNLQQNLVSGLKKARISELKSMLQNVPVPSPTKGGTSIGAKFAVSALVAAAITTGLYLYLTRPEPQTEAFNKSEPKAETNIPDKDEEKKKVDPDKTLTTEPSEPESEKQTTKEERAAEIARKENPKQSPARQPVIDVFDPSKEGEETVAAGDESAKASRPVEESRIPAEVVKSKIYSFHYQFKDEKLFLYGPFEDGLYEIMEFFNDAAGEERTVFLFYKDKYYLLEQSDAKIKPLKAITDAALINKLTEYRGK
jgi:hypothetical protein